MPGPNVSIIRRFHTVYTTYAPRGMVEVGSNVRRLGPGEWSTGVEMSGERWRGR